MRNCEPSLILNGLDLSDSTLPGAVRSMTKSGRPSTSKAREVMAQRRLSEGSTGRGVPVERPREAFQRLSDSSFLSVLVDQLE